MLFILSIIPLTSIALTLSGPDPCRVKWPKKTPPGNIEMKYRISETCEPKKVNFIVSKPKGAFNDYAMCKIKQLSPYWYWDSSKAHEVITEEEYKKRTKEEPKPPEKFKSTEIHAVDNKGKTIKLACYFNKEGVLTSREVDNRKTIKSVTVEYINKLPEQSFKAEFKTEH